MLTYKEKLNDPRWKKKRDSIILRDLSTCQVPHCKKTDNLQVHHRYYIFGIEPWDYPDDVLITMCATHHEEELAREKTEKALLFSLQSRGFFLSDLMALSCKLDTDLHFTQALLKVLRNG